MPAPAPLQTKFNTGIQTGLNIGKTMAPGVTAVKNIMGMGTPAQPTPVKPVAAPAKFDFNKPADWATMDKAGKDAWLRKAKDASYAQTQATTNNWNQFADKRVAQLENQAKGYNQDAQQRENSALHSAQLANTGYNLAPQLKSVGESGTATTRNANSDMDYSNYQTGMANFYDQQAKNIRQLIPGYRRQSNSYGDQQARPFNPLAHPSTLGIPGYFHNGYHEEYSGNPWGEGVVPKTGSDVRPTQVLSHLLKVAEDTDYIPPKPAPPADTSKFTKQVIPKQVYPRQVYEKQVYPKQDYPRQVYERQTTLQTPPKPAPKQVE